MSENTNQTERSLYVRGQLTNAPLLYATPDALATMSTYEQQIRKTALDNFVAAGMRRQHSILVEEQQSFITKQLEEHPVEIGRRAHSPSSSGLEETTKAAEPVDRNTALLREQRAASCRKSRMNNKLRKAALQHRSVFMAEKVAATEKIHANLTAKLKIAQQSLLHSGFNSEQLEHLRAMYGVSHLPIN